MKIILTEPCGIEHTAEAELVGVEDNGYVLYRVRFNIDNELLWDAAVNVDELPCEASLEVIACREVNGES